MSEFTRLKQRIENIRATGNPVPSALSIRYMELRPRIVRSPKPKKVKKASKPPRPKFYRSPEWKQLRYMILAHRGARCECCGVTPAEGAKMNVDHVIPISRAWDRRLDPTNLQVLCGSCNQGKGGRSDDWREG
jgi:5-methylcytosine-specific restriction endonuclease McrA